MDAVFWICLFTLAYGYVGYPVLVWIVGKTKAGAPEPRPWRPFVSVVIAAHNEAAHIQARLYNLLYEQDYPAERYEVLLGSDGSTDRTVEAARSVRDPRLTVYEFPRQRGKPSVLNALIRQAKGEVIVFADARQRFRGDAMRRLVERLADERVGACSGSLVFESDEEEGVSKGIMLYWAYETFLRRQESRIHSMLGAAGAIYAAKRDLIVPLPGDIILDDLWIPLHIVQRGKRVVLEEEAVAYDRPQKKAAGEFNRKVRTLYGNFQLFARRPEWILPGSHPVWWMLWSHKIFRLLAPYYFIGLWVSALWLGRSDPWVAAFWGGQNLCYATGIATGLSKGRFCGMLGPLAARLGTAAWVFITLNAAAVVALGRFLFGRQPVAWKQEGRPVENEKSASRL